MPLKVPDVGEIVLLDHLSERFQTLGMTMRLFQSNHTPANSDTLATYTAMEADFSGYAPAALTGWGAATDDGSGRAIIAANFASFTHNGGATDNDIYGYFIVDDDTGDLAWAELDPGAPRVMNSAGATYVVRARLTLKTEF